MEELFVPAPQAVKDVIEKETQGLTPWSVTNDKQWGIVINGKYLLDSQKLAGKIGVTGIKIDLVSNAYSKDANKVGAYGIVTLSELIQGESRMPANYQGIVIREFNGGGVGAVNWAILDKKLYVGMITQKRPRVKPAMVPNFPRGFQEKGRSRKDMLYIELKDEQAIPPTTPLLLSDYGINFNTAYFSTKERSINEGFVYFGMNWPAHLLQKQKNYYVPDFKSPEITQKEKDLLEPIAQDLIFVHWKDAAIGKIPGADLSAVDAINSAGILELLLFLSNNKYIELDF